MIMGWGFLIMVWNLVWLEWIFEWCGKDRLVIMWWMSSDNRIGMGYVSNSRDMGFERSIRCSWEVDIFIIVFISFTVEVVVLHHVFSDLFIDNEGRVLERELISSVPWT